jgi:hypothetical protein
MPPIRRLFIGAFAAGSLIVATGLPAVAVTSTATLTGGTLGFVAAPAATGFPTITLSGVDQTTTSTQTFDVADATGSGSGWNITATSTTFTAGSHALPTTAVTVQAVPTVACDAGASCTVATNGTSYPYTLPAGATAPTATKIFSSGANTGLGDQTVTLVFKLSVPASAFAGSYSSTWTYTLVSGP